jgi:hypothetical protein
MNETLVRQLARRTGAGTSISMDDLRDKSIVDWAGDTQFVLANFPDTAEASYEFSSGGTGWTFLSGVGSEYQIRATQVSNTGTAFRTGTLNTFESLSSNRTWSISTNSLGFKDWVLTIEIREAVGNTIVASATLDLSVEVI